MAGGEPGGLTAWAEAQRGSSMSEVWRTLGPFIVEHRPAFGADVAKRFSGVRQQEAHVHRHMYADCRALSGSARCETKRAASRAAAHMQRKPLAALIGSRKASCGTGMASPGWLRGRVGLITLQARASQGRGRAPQTARPQTRGSAHPP